MKKIAVILALTLSALLLAACGKSEFGVIQNDPDRIVITAAKADKDAFFVTGTLTAEEGQKITASAELEKGSIRVEIYPAPEGVSDISADVSELTDLGEPILTGNLKADERVEGAMPAGDYLVKAICLERASGTVQITVEAP